MAAWTVPGYTETGVLGAGGTGRVVEAVHDESGVRVAIKYLSARLCADESFRERFRAEAALLTELEHPNVVRFRELVETDLDAAPVMELVEGATLHAVLAAAAPLSPEAALAVLRESLLGLGAAHAVGVVHRDYKPSNVLVTTEGVSKLADFGVAARTEAMMPTAGTPSYMAPEQWEGAPAQPAGDIYAATATFFECLTGHVPFSAESVFELQTMHRAAPIPVGDVPEAVRPLVAQGLAKAAAERPAEVAAFLAELEAAAVVEYGLEWEERGRRDLTAVVLPLAGGGEDGGSGGASDHAAGLAEAETSVLPIPRPREDEDEDEAAAAAAAEDAGEGGGIWYDDGGSWDGSGDERGGMGRGTKAGLAAAAVAVIGAVVAAVAFAPGKSTPLASGKSGEIVTTPTDTAASSDGGSSEAAVAGSATSGSSSAGNSSATKPSSSGSTKPTTTTTSSGVPVTTATLISLPLPSLTRPGAPPPTSAPGTSPPSTTPASPSSDPTTPTSSSTLTISASAHMTTSSYTGTCPPTSSLAGTVAFTVDGVPSGSSVLITYHWRLVGANGQGSGDGWSGGRIDAQNGTASQDFTVDISSSQKSLSGRVEVTWSAPGTPGGTTSAGPVTITCT